MNDFSKDILGAIKSSKEENKEFPPDLVLDGVNSLMKNTNLTPIVEETGSAYTAQNNLLVSNLPVAPDKDAAFDVNYSYQSIVKKPYYIKSFQITTTSSIGVPLFSLELPRGFFEANTILGHVGQTFTSFKGTFHILVSVQGSPQASGAMIVVPQYAVDIGNASDLIFKQETLFRQHVILDYSDNSSTADLVVPFRYWRDGVDPLKTVHFVRFYPLVALAGTGTVTCTISVFVEDPQFRFLRPITAAIERETQGLLNFTTVNNTFQDIIDSTIPTNITGDTLDIQPKMMDAVPVATNPSPLIVKYNSFNNADNPFPVERMSMISSANNVSDRSTFGIDVDEMDMLQILKRDNYLATFNITTATATNSDVFATYVTPNTMWASPDRYNAMSFIATKFKFWRGGLRYKFRFFLNRFQSVKLYASMFYKALDPSTLTDFSGSHGVVLDIGGDQREVEIEVPYNAETPWLMNVYRTGQDLSTDTVQTYALGKIALYNMTPLVSPTGSPTTITCIVTVSAADDFEFASYAPVTTETQGKLVRLSALSDRKVGDQMDIPKSLKTYFKRYADAVSWKSDIDLNKYSVYGAVLYPTIRQTSTGATTNFTSGRTNIISPFHNRFPLAGLFSGHRGGMTARIALTYAITGPNLTDRRRLVPYCYYFNPAFTNQNQTLHLNGVCSTLNNYIVNNLSSSAGACPTPYVVQPVNMTTSESGMEVIYEVDCPYSHALKYAPTYGGLGFYAHGFIVAGFYDPLKQDIGEDTGCIFSTQMSLKISDDSRFGILEKGSFTVLNTLQNETSWGASTADG